jgi:nicotinamidase-related amidase
MADIFIPNPEHRRALIIVDMQSGFLNDKIRWIIPNIQEVIRKGNYDLHVEATFHAEPGSLWDRQTDWTFKLEPTIQEIKRCLESRESITVTKTTKSAFQSDKDLVSLFKEKNIEEVHIVGVDANDCVLATAFDSFDAGFFTYVIEECVESSNGGTLRDSALAILRNVDLTNHSSLIKKSA